MAIWTVNTTTASGSVDTATRTGALAQILAAMNDGDTIVFDSSLEDPQTGVVTILLSSPLILPALAFIIDGGETWVESGVSKTRVVLDGQSGTGIATTTAGTAAAINGVTFINGASTNGGALYIVEASSVSIRDCVFNKNEARGGRGGAIYNKGTLSVSGTESIPVAFEGNKAVGVDNNGVFKYGDGGAIFVYPNASVEVSKASFVENTSSRYGGAISTYGRSLTLTDTSFENNTSGYGGAVQVAGGTEIVGSFVARSNHAITDESGIAIASGDYDGRGGAIWLGNNASLTLGGGATFTENDATATGGAIHVTNGDLTVNGAATFTSNRAFKEVGEGEEIPTTAGGAIYNNGSLVIGSEDEVVFTSNSAYIGGAIYTQSSATVANTTFNRNTADFGGGALYLFAKGGYSGEYAFIGSNLAFNGNESLGVDGDEISGNGGAVFNSIDATFSGISMEGNEAIKNGDDIYNYNGSKLTIIGETNAQDFYCRNSSVLLLHGALSLIRLYINNGASVTFSGVDAVLAVTTTATIGSATFTAAEGSTGYVALPSGTTAPTVGTGVKVATHGAEATRFTAFYRQDGNVGFNIAKTNAVPVLLERQDDGEWTTLSDDASSETVDANPTGDAYRIFDGRFLTTTPKDFIHNGFYVVNDWVEAKSNGGAGRNGACAFTVEAWAIDPELYD